MKKLAVLFAMLLAAVALVACGGSDNSSSEASTEAPPAKEGGTEEGEGAEAEGGTAGSAGTVDIEADPSGNLAFTTDAATSKAGKVTVDFTNDSPIPHNVAIEDSGGETIGETETLAEGSASTTVELKPGKYTFYCSVPGHREQGMEGTLTVK
jgi:plastocyanin